jgi:hypothetical protein
MRATETHFPSASRMMGPVHGELTLVHPRIGLEGNHYLPGLQGPFLVSVPVVEAVLLLHDGFEELVDVDMGFMRRSRQSSSTPSASANRLCEKRKFTSMRLKSSSAWAYMRPKLASASVAPWMCGMPQSSRVMEMSWALASQAATSGSDEPGAAQAVMKKRENRRSFFMGRMPSRRVDVIDRGSLEATSRERLEREKKLSFT